MYGGGQPTPGGHPACLQLSFRQWLLPIFDNETGQRKRAQAASGKRQHQRKTWMIAEFRICFHGIVPTEVIDEAQDCERYAGKASVASKEAQAAGKDTSESGDKGDHKDREVIARTGVGEETH